jgi:hypothetical protein
VGTGINKNIMQPEENIKARNSRRRKDEHRGGTMTGKEIVDPGAVQEA